MNTYASSKILVLTVFLSVLSFPLQAASEKDQNVFTALPGGLSHLATGPLRWNEQEWALVGMTALGVGVLISQDDHLRQQIQRGLGPSDHRFWKNVTHLGDGGIQGLLAVGGMTLGNENFSRTSAAALQGLAISAVTVIALKTATGSLRPSVLGPGEERGFFDYERGSISARSFPSGHTASSFAMAEVYGASYGRWWTYPLAAMIGYSRLAMDKHWTSDVLAGALLGIACGRVAMNEAKKKGPANRWWGLRSRQGLPTLAAGLNF